MAFWKVCAVVLLAACIMAKETEVATSDLTPQETKKSHGYGTYSSYGSYGSYGGGYSGHYSRPIYINNYASSGYSAYPSYQGYVNRYPSYGYSSHGTGYGHEGYGSSYGHGYRPVHDAAPTYGFGY